MPLLHETVKRQRPATAQTEIVRGEALRQEASLISVVYATGIIEERDKDGNITLITIKHPQQDAAMNACSLAQAVQERGVVRVIIEMEA